MLSVAKAEARRIAGDGSLDPDLTTKDGQGLLQCFPCQPSAAAPSPRQAVSSLVAKDRRKRNGV